MRKKDITIKAVLAAMACTACVNLSAQEKEYPQPEKMTPGMSEYWTPQPKIVTPGDIETNSAPSDAIVLFDGKDLSAWENTKGEPAQWTVHDGVFTVNKKQAISRPSKNSTIINCTSNGAFLKILPEKVRHAATAVSLCKECMKYRCSTAITMKHT